MPSTITDRLNGLTTSVAVKAPCRVATTANITLSGEQTIDDVAVVSGDRVLVKEQTSALDNGIWIVSTGTWTRAPDFDGTLDVVGGTQLYVISGTVNGSTYWRADGSGAKTPATDSITFTTISGTTTLASDLASTATGKGAALIGTEGGDTVEEALAARQVTIATFAGAKALDIETVYGTGVEIIIQDRMATRWVKHTGAALDSDSEDYWWFTDAGAAVWKLAYTGVVDPIMCGAAGDAVIDWSDNTVTGTDDSAACQAAIDYFQTQALPGSVQRSRLHRISSVQTLGTGWNMGLQAYGDGIRFTVTSPDAGFAFDASAATTNYRGLHISGGGKVSDDTNTNRVVDATGYAINATVAKGTRTVTLVTGGDTANFAAGDIVYLRTGQTLAGTTEPSSELNIVESVSSPDVVLKYPVAATYAQEYYKSGTSGLTDTASTANPAPFTLANVTARASRGIFIDGLLFGHNCEQVLNIWGLIDVEVPASCRIFHGKNGFGSRETRNVDMRARLYHTARVNTGYFGAPSTGCTHWTWEMWGQSQGYAYFHIHEHVKKLLVPSVFGQVLGNVGESNVLFEILARCEDIVCLGGYLDSGASSASSIAVGSTADALGNYCDGGVTFGPLQIRNNSAGGSAVLVNGANVAFSQEPQFIGTNARMSLVTYLRDPTHGMKVGNRLTGPFLYDRELHLGTVGQDAEIVEIRQRYDLAFATGDRRFRMGFSGTDNAYLNDQIINTAIAGDVVVTARGGTSAGTSLGAPQSGTRAIVAKINASSGTTDFTAGRMRVTVLLNQTARTS